MITSLKKLFLFTGFLFLFQESYALVVYDHYRLRCIEGKNILSKGKKDFDFFSSLDVIPAWQCFSSTRGRKVVQDSIFEVLSGSPGNGYRNVLNRSLLKYRKGFLVLEKRNDSIIVNYGYHLDSLIKTNRHLLMNGCWWSKPGLNLTSPKDKITIYKILSQRDTVFMSPGEKDSLRYLCITSWEEGFPDPLADSLFAVNRLDSGWAGPDRSNRVFPKQSVAELQYPTTGFIFYNRYTKVLSTRVANSCTYSWEIPIVNISDNVITMPGRKQVREIITNNICRWDPENRLLIQYELWPEYLFNPHAIKIKGDLVKLMQP